MREVMQAVRRWWDSWLIVALALAIAILIRLQGLGNPYIKAFDPYFFWRVAQGIWEKGYWEANDSLRYYPYGWDSRELAPFLPYSFVYLGKFAGDLKAAVKFYPALFGLLSILAMAFLGRELGIAGLASFVLAILPAYIFRTSQGFADKEPAAFFLGILSWFFLIRSLKKNSWADAIYGGLSAGLIATIWGGKILFVLALVPLMVMLVLMEDVEKMKNLALYFLSYFLPHLAVPRYRNILADPYAILILSLAFFAIFMYLVYRSKKLEKLGRKRMEISVALGIVFLLLLSAARFGSPFYIPAKVYEKFTSPVLPTGKITHYHTVAENQRPSWTWNLKSNQFYQQFGLFFFLSLASLAFFYSKKLEDLFVASIALFSLYTSFSAIRLFSFSAIGVALSSAYVLAKLFENRDVLVRASGYLALALSLYLLFPYTYATAIGVKGSSLTTTWFENLKWMAFNVPENEPVVTWWDYGYWIQTLAHRKSLGDGGNMPPGYKLNWYTGHFFATDDYENATSWAKSWNLTYFTIDYAMIPKYWAYSTLGGISNVINTLRRYGQIYTPQFGFVNIFVGYSDDLGPVAVAPVEIGREFYPVIGRITNKGINWEGIAREYAIIRANKVKICPPIGYCKAKALSGFPLLNQSVIFYGDSYAYIGDFRAMHSVFARLWFFNGYNTSFRLLLNNGETKTFRFEG